jgi:hypothetical protein
MLFDPNAPDQSTAAFLIVRGSYAWHGFPWMDFNQYPPWHSNFGLQVGIPQGDCTQTSSHSWSRPWTYGVVTLDCNSWTASIPNSGAPWQPPAPATAVYTMPLQQNLSELTTGMSGMGFFVADGASRVLDPVFSTSPGNHGSAYQTSNTGIQQYVGVPPVGGFVGDSGSFGVALWAYLQSSPGTSSVLVAAGTGSSLAYIDGFGLWLSQSYVLGFVMGTSFSSTPVCSAQLSQATAFGSWMHVAATYDAPSGAAKLYVNGTVASSTSGVSPYAGWTLLQVGYLSGFSYPANAWFQWLTYSNAAFTQQQVHAMYAAYGT